MSPVRDDHATARCPIDGRAFIPERGQRFCSTKCRQAAWRRTRQAPVAPVARKIDTVYQCPNCEARYLGEQRCDDCNTWCVRIGPGGLCPCCEEPVAVRDIVSADQFAPPSTKT